MISKTIWSSLNFIVTTYWGFTVMSLFLPSKNNITSIDLLDRWTKIVFSIIGLVVLIYRLKEKTLDIKIKKEELAKLKKDNETPNESA